MIEKQSALLEEKKDIFDRPDYNDEEKLYLKNLQIRLEYAKRERDKPRDEFDGLTYGQYWTENEKGANTTLKPKKDKKEIRFQSGTLRQKMMAFLSSLLSLNLKSDISAFDENDMETQGLSTAIEDIVEKTEELENDEEKKILRYYEQLKQGDVFLEEIWNEKKGEEKEITEEWDGKFRTKNWKIKEEKYLGCPERNILHPLSVYLGDLSKYFIEDQPFIFTINTISYQEAKQKYDKWENFKYVPKTSRKYLGETEQKLMMDVWQLQDNLDGEVEVIKIQDVPNNEYQILLNGIPQMPLGYPLPWGKRYNIIQQHFEPIRHNFAYGKSFIFRNKNNIYLLDEMIKMALLKTWKSFMPSYLNIGNRIIPDSVFMPGKISMGIIPNTLIPVSEKEQQGVTNGEFTMIQEMIRFIDQNTSSQTFGGMQEKGQTTATQIVELQRQARIMMGLTILSAGLLEKKLSQIRTENILQNWFNPIDQKVDKIRDKLKNRYRIISKNKIIEGEGMGKRMIVPTEEMMMPEEIRMDEDNIKGQLGYPIRFILINPNVLKETKYTWRFSVVPKEKKSSEMSKVMFGEMLAQGMQLGLQFNPKYIQEEFAIIWDKDPTKLFVSVQQNILPENQNQQNQQIGIKKPSLEELTKNTENTKI